ncbi:MAG: ATP-binding protein [Sneathiella sp.]
MNLNKLSTDLLQSFKGVLAKKFAVYVFLASTFLSLLISSYQLYQDYLLDLSVVDQRLDELGTTQLSNLSLHLWNYDQEGLRVVSKAIFALDLVQYVEIKDVKETLLIMGGKEQGTVRRRVFPLNYDSWGTPHHVGEMIVHASLESVYQHILDQALVIIVGNTFKTFIVSAIILIMFYRIIGRHLSRVGNFATNFRVDETVKKLELDRKTTHTDKKDELDRLVTAISKMQDRIDQAFLDVIAREKAENFQRLSDNRFRDFAESSSDWFWEMDANLRFSFISDRYEQITGRNAADLIGSKRWGIESQTNPLQDWEPHKSDMYARRPFKNFAFTIETKDKKLMHIHTSGVPVFSQDGKFTGYRGSTTDVTEQKNLEIQLQQAHRLEAVGQLTGGIAHDFNNILGIVSGNLEIVQRLPLDDSRIPGRLDVARKSINRGAEITRKLLGFSRKNSYAVQLVDLNDSVNSLLELVTKSLTVSIDVKAHLANDLWSVEIDPGDFEDVFINLALNARDAMPDGGKLTIETENKILDKKFVERNSQAATGNFVLISIRDTGTGMTKNVADKVFEPFFTTKEVGKGTGLGLSMVYGFVERSGGFITIDSEIGWGTAFHLFIPQAGKNETDLTVPEIASGDLPPGDERILIVDDEEGLRDIAVFNLGELGYKTIVAEDGPSALTILEQDPDIDLLFSDIVMPNFMNAYELAQKVHQSHPQLKILLTSGYDRKLSDIENSDDPFLIKLNKSQLNKPYSTSELAIAIREALDE